MASDETPTHRGQCFCGAVKIEATGQPFTMGYCHCEDCRAWAAAPVTSFTLWKPEAVAVSEGAASLATYSKTEMTQRQYCARCGGHVMSANPGGGFIDVYPALLPTLAFEPAMHVYYGESVLPIADGLPKFRDLPAKAGGSGELSPE